MGALLQERPFESLTIAGGRLVAFDQPEEAGSRIIDLDGAWVVPGLVDAHVHLELTAAPDPFEQWNAPMPERMASLIRNGLVALASGTLAVRDLGSADDKVVAYGRLTDSGRVLGPRVVAAGQMISMTGGHLWRFAREADGPDDVRRAVREQIRSGAGVIKLMATGGLTTPGHPGSPELGEDELTVAVREARHAGLPVAAHAHGPEGIRAAVRAGVTTIEHGALIGPEECDLMIAAGVALVPTLAPVLRIRAGEGINPDVVAKTEAIRSSYVQNVARAIERGVRIVAGTDAGCAFNPVGGIADEVHQFVRVGMNPAEALRTCTVGAGEALGGGDLGRLDLGGLADMVIVREDPRNSIRALRDPLRVIRRGSDIDLAGLETMIDALGGRDSSVAPLDAGQILRGGEQTHAD